MLELSTQDADLVVRTETIAGAETHFLYYETWDGLYAPMALRLPPAAAPTRWCCSAWGTGARPWAGFGKSSTIEAMFSMR